MKLFTLSISDFSSSLTAVLGQFKDEIKVVQITDEIREKLGLEQRDVENIRDLLEKKGILVIGEGRQANQS